MKRYLLFAYDEYYPSGGWYDFRGSFDSIEEAKKFCDRVNRDWAEIVDSQEGKVLLDGIRSTKDKFGDKYHSMDSAYMARISAMLNNEDLETIHTWEWKDQDE